MERTMTNTEKLTQRIRTIDFNHNWKFSLNDDLISPSNKHYDDSLWEQVTLPHDWSIFFDFDHDSPAQNEGGLLNGGHGWYRKSFNLDETLEGSRILINFSGVYMDSTVFVNGVMVGNYPNGYTPFEYDITDYVYFDSRPNVISVKVVNEQPSSRWYSGSGIYRNVSLSILNPVHVQTYGTRIETPNLENEYQDKVNVKVSTKLSRDLNSNQRLSYEIRDSNDQVITSDSSSDLWVSKPNLWSIDSPTMYTLITRVFEDNELIDEVHNRFGFRFIKLDPDNGFYLNGEYLKLQGVCMHHDHGALGSVSHKESIIRQMNILKRMGTNAIRVSHNPGDDILIPILEDMGFLMIDEAFDTWFQGKKKFDYGRFFEAEAEHPYAPAGTSWAEFDIKQMVRRGINSPSIIMWSIGNEISESNDGSEHALTTVKNLNKWVKEIDESRFTTMGQDVYRWASTGPHEAISEVLDAVGLNYAEDSFDIMRERHPKWNIYGSETSSAIRSRGVYALPDELPVHDNSQERKYQQSDYGNDRVIWGRTATESYRIDRDNRAYSGQFIWTGFDYIGEPTPWHNDNKTPAKSSYFGLVDTAGYPKNDFYLYQSQWSNKPMVHIFPHWNWDDEELLDFNMRTADGKIPLRVFSNLENVELFLNNESLGVKSFNKKVTSDGREYLEGESADKLYLEWRLDFVPGELRAVAFDDADRVDTIVKTAKDPVGIKLNVDTQNTNPETDELIYVEVSLVDDLGIEHPTADNLIHFELEGAGTIVGVDNGNPSSLERYKDTKRHLFSGKALVIILLDKNFGGFKLNASTEGLVSTTLEFDRPVKSDEFSLELSVNNTMVKIDETVEYNLRVFNNNQIVHHHSFEFEFNVDSDYLSNGLSALKSGTTKLNVTGVSNDLSIESNKVEVVITNDCLEREVESEPTFVVAECFSMQSPVGMALNLPTHARAFRSDGSYVSTEIQWEAIDEERLSYANEFRLKGILDQTSIETTLFVRVSEEYLKGFNISQTWTGSNLPAGIASHSDSGYFATALNDAQDDSEWRSSVSDGSHWFGVLFADAGTLDKRFINNINIDFFEDFTSSYSIEYFVGDLSRLPKNFNNVALDDEYVINDDTQWVSVENLSSAGHEHTFKGVLTHALRVRVSNEVSVRQIRVYDTLPCPKSGGVVSLLQKDGELVLDPKMTHYSIEGDYKIKSTLNMAYYSVEREGGIDLYVKQEGQKNWKKYRINHL